MQPVPALPAVLLQGERQLLADATGAHGFLRKQNRTVGLQRFAKPLRQRVDLHELVAVGRNAFLRQQVGRGQDLLTLGAVTDKGDLRPGLAGDAVKRLPAAAQRSQGGGPKSKKSRDPCSTREVLRRAREWLEEYGEGC